MAEIEQLQGWHCTRANSEGFGGVEEKTNTLHSINFDPLILHDFGIPERLPDLLRVTLPAHEKVGSESIGYFMAQEGFLSELSPV